MRCLSEGHLLVHGLELLLRISPRDRAFLERILLLITHLGVGLFHLWLEAGDLLRRALLRRLAMRWPCRHLLLRPRLRLVGMP